MKMLCLAQGRMILRRKFQPMVDVTTCTNHAAKFSLLIVYSTMFTFDVLPSQGALQVLASSLVLFFGINTYLNYGRARNLVKCVKNTSVFALA